jgi:hypothetical protein
LSSNIFCQRQGGIKHLIVIYYFLHHTYSKRGFGIKFITGKQVALSIGVAKFLNHSNGGAAAGHNSSPNFNLPKASSSPANSHLGTQGKLNPNGVTNTVYCHDNRFTTTMLGA